MRTIGYLGPEGTFSEEAAVTYDADAKRVAYPSIPQVTAAVESDEVDEAVLPIENSLQGSVTDVLDFLIRTEKAQIKRELAIPVNNCLMVAKGTKPGDVELIYSHPQPLGQCRRYLAANYPRIELVASLSTAGAVGDMLASDRPAAAIAPRRAAEIYGAQILAEAIQDSPSNFTRFVVLAAADHERTGRDKTSIAFSFDSDGPGLLYTALGTFATRGINLTKIESRPTGESLGRYVFLADVEGHRSDELIITALDELRAQTSELKVFGSYPRMERPGTPAD